MPHNVQLEVIATSVSPLRIQMDDSHDNYNSYKNNEFHFSKKFDVTASWEFKVDDNLKQVISAFNPKIVLHKNKKNITIAIQSTENLNLQTTSEFVKEILQYQFVISPPFTFRSRTKACS